MSLFSRLIFYAVHFAARKGLRENADESADSADPGASAVIAAKLRARQTGIRGETYAYWYLRRHGYIFIARNFTPRSSKGELDMVGYDGATLAFVEVRTRTLRDDSLTALPELSVTPGKQHVLVRTALYFLSERHVPEGPLRFDVLAIDNAPGHPPVVRLHKDAFSPQM
jgi:putative endonuclease